MTENGARGFPRSSRVLEKKAYQRVFERATKLAGKHFVVLARPNALGHPRLGLAISKKAAKSAVERNRIKRVCRESFRHRQAELPGVDLVVMAQRSRVVGTPNAALFQDLDKLWSKLIGRCEGS